MNFEDVFKKSWDAYKNNLGMLLLVVLLGALLVGVFLIPGIIALIVGIAGSTDQETFLNVFSVAGLAIFIISFILAMMASIIYGAALIKSVSFAEGGEKIDIKKAFLVAYQKFWLILATSIIAGVLMLIGFILFVIPGLILAVYFQFIMYVVIFENKWGVDAIKRSYEIVKGNFWWVVLIILLVALASGLIGSIPFVGGIITFILTPFWQVIMYVVYKDLKGMKGESE